MKQFKSITKVTRLHPRTVRVDMVYDKDFSQGFTLQADEHWDNTKCDRSLLHKHLKEAVSNGDGIINIGDFFCAMQGKYDRRSSKTALRPEHQTGNYLDSLVSTAIDDLSPYANNYICMSPGNHETAIQGRHETNLTDRLVSGLNLSTGSNIQTMTYAYWIIFAFHHRAGGRTRTKTMNCFHGAGGGGAVTKGVIQTNRRQVAINADFFASGHIHEDWTLTNMKEELSINTGEPKIERVEHIQIPTYKEEYLAGYGWHVERAAPPKPTGCKRLEFFFEGGEIKHKIYSKW